MIYNSKIYFGYLKSLQRAFNSNNYQNFKNYSYKTYDIVRNLIDLTTKTLIQSLFFDNYK